MKRYFVTEILYNGIVRSEADIETLKWLLGKWTKEMRIRVIVEKEEREDQIKEGKNEKVW